MKIVKMEWEVVKNPTKFSDEDDHSRVPDTLGSGLGCAVERAHSPILLAPATSAVARRRAPVSREHIRHFNILLADFTIFL